MKVAKNQHFVPQFLIKNFSNLNSNRVCVYDSSRELLRENVLPSNVLSQNYFYDRDNQIENFLGKYVETPGSISLNWIASYPKEKFSGNKIDVLRFISVQICRTPKALADNLTNIDNMTDDIIRKIGQVNGFDEDVINEIKYVPDDTKAILGNQVVMSALMWPILDDLEWHVLINGTETKFVISDHPVVFYNWYLRESKQLGSSGLASCGLQIFIPISHSVTLCLYDKKVYKVGDKKSTYTTINDVSDVLLLNELQIRNRESNVIFSSSGQSCYIQKKCKELPSDSLYSRITQSSELEPFEGDELRSTYMSIRENIIFSKWLSFSKVRNKVSRRKVECYIRKPDVVHGFDEYIKGLNKQALNHEAVTS